MKKSTVAWLVGLGVILVVGFSLLIAYVSAANTANVYEQNLKASFTNSQNVLSKLAPQLKEALGVTKLEVNAVRDIVTAANESRYGADGNSAAVALINEQNPNYNPANFGKIVDLIISGRNDFATAQERTTDINRAYQTALGAIPGGMFMKWAGYPTEDYKSHNYENIVKSGHATEAFEKREDNGLNINSF